jgi:hypothetical protein
MSTVLVVTPVLIASWPAITAAVTAAVGTMGFAAAATGAQAASSIHGRSDGKTRAEIELEDSEIMADVAAGLQQEIVVQRDKIIARFTRDSRGALRVCMEGEGVAKSELKRVGEELVGRVTQQYVYHRLMTEMKDRHMTVIHEEVDEDHTVRIRVRNT